jgi:hypothetical protein
MFWYHQFIAHHQQREFDQCINNLPQNHIAILEDLFVMNYSHTCTAMKHRGSTGSTGKRPSSIQLYMHIAIAQLGTWTAMQYGQQLSHS